MRSKRLRAIFAPLLIVPIAGCVDSRDPGELPHIDLQQHDVEREGSTVDGNAPGNAG